MGGEDALKLIREEENARGGHTPIIALTAHALDRDRDRLLRTGFDGYLSKPVLVEDLIEQMKRCVNLPAGQEMGEMTCP
jgi:CheY-like chemotaxis protein